MYALIDLFWDICLLRKGPQALPSSQPLLKLSLVAYGLSSLIFLLLIQEPLLALLQALTDIVLLAGLVYAVLTVTRFSLRFVQTLTALAGTGTLLGLVALPIFIWIDQEVASNGDAIVPRLLFLGLIIWHISVVAHVLHHALSSNRWVGLLYALGYYFISWTVMDLLFPLAQ